MNYAPGPRSLRVFDFDGTLSTIVPDRDKARLRRECERMSFLQRLRDRAGIKVYRGHEAVEVQLVRGGGPADLARAVREFADAAPNRTVENAGGVA